MEAYTGADGLGVYLSGGASNYLPSASLGGVISAKLVRGMNAIYTTPVQGLVIVDASPDNGPGVASLHIDNDGNAVYTPPDDTAGTAVAVAEDDYKILTGADITNYVSVHRLTGKEWIGTAVFRLVDMLNGAIGMADVDDTDRQAGSTRYRGLFLRAHETVQDIMAWVTTDGQSAFALASEAPVDDEIQVIGDEETAPTSVSWVAATTRATALSLGRLAGDDTLGLWVRRTFPSSGTVSAKEQVNFHLEFKGA